jgi:hypothetical protein
MIKKFLTPVRTLALVWIALPVLVAILYSVGGSLQDGWRARPPSDVEETDCRIESMMGGDNPVEVETIHRACIQAANDAYVHPRRTRLLLLSGLLVLAWAAFATAFTARRWPLRD